MNIRKRRFDFVINPTSCIQDKGLVVSQIKEVIDGGNIDPEIRFTENAGLVVDIAAKAANEGRDVVAAVGNKIGNSPVEDGKPALANEIG